MKNHAKFEIEYIPTKGQEWLAHIQRNFILYRRVSLTLDILAVLAIVAMISYFIFHY